MLRFDFSTSDVAHTSLALSPLWELVCSLRVLQMPSSDAAYRPWLEETQRRVPTLPELPLLVALVPTGHYLPDFLTPPPDTPLPDLPSELDVLMATPPAQVRRDLAKAYPGGLPELLVPIAQRPKAGLRVIADALQAYWDCALADTWPQLRDVLTSDIVHRGHEFAVGGASRLFGDLHPTVSWSGESLIVDKDWSLHLRLGGQGLLLLPSAFAWPAILTITAATMRPTLIYPARGVANLWPGGEVPSAVGGLARLIGRQRASLLASLNRPTSTTELARRTTMTAGGVSQHLTLLRDTGLIRGSRAGRVVLYARTPLGETLVASIT